MELSKRVRTPRTGSPTSGPPTCPGGIFLRTDISELPPKLMGAYERSRIHADDIVIAIRASIGKALIVPPYLDGANLTQGTAKFSPSRACDSRFMLHFLNSVASVGFARVAKGAAFREITLDMLRKPRSAVRHLRLQNFWNQSAPSLTRSPPMPNEQSAFCRSAEQPLSRPP
jgi:hypothetical protein